VGRKRLRNSSITFREEKGKNNLERGKLSRTIRGRKRVNCTPARENQTVWKEYGIEKGWSGTLPKSKGVVQEKISDV